MKRIAATYILIAMACKYKEIRYALIDAFIEKKRIHHVTVCQLSSNFRNYLKFVSKPKMMMMLASKRLLYKIFHMIFGCDAIDYCLSFKFILHQLVVISSEKHFRYITKLFTLQLCVFTIHRYDFVQLTHGVFFVSRWVEWDSVHCPMHRIWNANLNEKSFLKTVMKPDWYSYQN